MEAIKNIGGFILLIVVMFFIAKSCEPSDPYEQCKYLTQMELL
jgi:hypothetical protein